MGKTKEIFMNQREKDDAQKEKENMQEMHERTLHLRGWDVRNLRRDRKRMENESK